MSDDEGQSYSAANLTRVGSASEDEYEEEGWDALRLQEHPVPGPPRLLDPRPPLLHVHTRRANTMAGNQIVRSCTSSVCRGCTPSCQQDHEEEYLYCDYCKLGRWDLCDRRDRCIEWSDAQFRQFQDLQMVARSGALEGVPPPASISSTTLTTNSAAVLKQPEPAVTSAQVEPEGAVGGGGLAPLATVSEQEREQTPSISSSASQVTPAPLSASTKEEAPPVSSLASVRPKVLVDKTKTPGLTGSSIPPIPYITRKGVPVGGGLVSHVTRETLARPKGYGTAAISPFTGHLEEEEEMMMETHPYNLETAHSASPWDGQGFPERSVNTGAREELWRQTRNIDLDDTNESFASPLAQTPKTENHETACRGRGLLGAQGRPRGTRSILKPPSFLPPVRQASQGDQYQPGHFEPHQYTPFQNPPEEIFLTSQERLQQRRLREQDRQRRPESQTRVTWSATSTPLRRSSSLEQGRRRIPVHQGEEEEETAFQFSAEEATGEEGTGVVDEGGIEALEGNQVKVAKVLEMLTQQLMQNKTGKANTSPAVKLPQMTLPTPARKSATGEVTAKGYYLWKANLAHSLRNFSLDPEAILLLYSNNEKLLPADWQSIFASSATLKEAICGLDMLFPPLQSVHPEIIKSMTNLPVLTSPTEKTKVFRISTLLRSLEQLIKLFGQDPAKDLSRQETMVIIYGLSSTSESRAELVTEISNMDRARKRGILYAQSLRDYLVRTRMILTDVIAAVQLVGRQEIEGKAKSAAAQLRIKEKGKEGKEGKKSFTCLLCSKSHPTFSCNEQLALLRSGQRTLPSKICKICLQANDEKHPKVCGEKRFLKDGVYQKINFRCAKGCGVNHRLCACKAGATIVIDKDQSPSPAKIGSAATRVVEIPQKGEVEQEEAGEGLGEREKRCEASSAANRSAPGEEDEVVIFQVENVLIQGRDSQTQLIAASFDTHGSSHFLSGDLSDNFNWAINEEDRSFEIDTIHGKTFTKHQVLEIKLLTLKGAVMLEAIKGSWIDPKEEETLNPETAARFGITTPELEDKEGKALPRIIIGCSKLNSLHPKSIPAPPGFQELHPNLACFKSKISRAVLCAGATGGGANNRF